MTNDNVSLSHTKWNCKYHIVFAPKYRRQEIYGKIKADIGKKLRRLCEMKGVEIIEAEACPDHIHMLVSIPLHLSVSAFVGYLKGCGCQIFQCAFRRCQYHRLEVVVHTTSFAGGFDYTNAPVLSGYSYESIYYPLF